MFPLFIFQFYCMRKQAHEKIAHIYPKQLATGVHSYHLIHNQEYALKQINFSDHTSEDLVPL